MKLKLLKTIGAITGFVAAILTILSLLGFLDPVKEFFAKLLHK